MEVTAAGKEVEGEPQVPQKKDAQMLAMLHYYRNCVTHRELIRFVHETVYVQVDVATGICNLIKEHERKKDMHNYRLEGAYFWIEMPDMISGTKYRKLLTVLEDLSSFVKTCQDHLLQYAGIHYGMFTVDLSYMDLFRQPAIAQLLS